MPSADGSQNLRPPTGQTREARKAAFRRLIMTTAESLLAGRRFSEITIDDILRAADVSRSTFYAHFADKPALLIALADEVFAQALVTAGEWLAPTATMTRSGLEHQLGGIFDLYAAHRPVITAVVETAGYEPTVGRWLHRSQDGAIATLGAGIAAGQRDGSIRAELIPRETAGWLIWMIERGLYQMAGEATTAETARLLHALRDVIWFTLYAAAEH